MAIPEGVLPYRVALVRWQVTTDQRDRIVITKDDTKETTRVEREVATLAVCHRPNLRFSIRRSSSVSLQLNFGLMPHEIASPRN